MSAHVVPTSGICESSTLRSTAPPLGIEPAAIEPAAVEPNPIEPAAMVPAGIDGSSELMVSALTPAPVTLTVICCDPREAPSAIAVTVAVYVPAAVPAGTVTVSLNGTSAGALSGPSCDGKNVSHCAALPVTLKFTVSTRLA